MNLATNIKRGRPKKVLSADWLCAYCHENANGGAIKKDCHSACYQRRRRLTKRQRSSATPAQDTPHQAAVPDGLATHHPAPSRLSFTKHKGAVLHFPGLLEEQAGAWIRGLESEVTFPAQRPVILNGVNALEPRDVAYFGQTGVASLTYCHLRHDPLPWTPTVLAIRQALQHLCGPPILPRSPLSADLTAALVNRYRDNQDSMGFHTDQETCLGCDPFIVSVSLGATRQFQLKKIKTKKIKHRLPLPNGTVVIMLGRTIQKCYKHGVPKEKDTAGCR